MPAPPSAAPSGLIDLRNAAERLGTAARDLGNIARQHGHCTAIGRETFFSEANVAAMGTLLARVARDRKNAAKAAVRPKASYGLTESKQLRKERRRVKKRLAPKEP